MKPEPDEDKALRDLAAAQSARDQWDAQGADPSAASGLANALSKAPGLGLSLMKMLGGALGPLASKMGQLPEAASAQSAASALPGAAGRMFQDAPAGTPIMTIRGGPAPQRAAPAPEATEEPGKPAMLLSGNQQPWGEERAKGGPGKTSAPEEFPPDMRMISFHGQPVGLVDMNSWKRKLAQQTQGAAETLVGQTQPADRGAAEQIFKAIKSGAITSPEELKDYAGRLLEPELERRQSGRNALQVATASGARAAASGAGGTNDDLEGIIKSFEQQYKAPNIHAMMDSADKVRQMIQSENPLAQRSAFTANLKAMFSSVTSDKELGFAQGAGGFINRLDTKFNDFFNGGALPDDYRELLDEATDLAQKQGTAALSKIGQITANGIMRTPTLRLDMAGRKQAAGYARGRITGDYGDTPEIGGPMGVTGAGGGGGVTRSARSKGDPQAVESAKNDGKPSQTFTGDKRLEKWAK